MSLKSIKTNILEIGYYEHGPGDGWPVILPHGFPYDVHSYDDVVPKLVEHGARVIVPYTRGYGPTRFLDASTKRSAEQAALASDIIALMDALSIPKALLAGFDWGGMSACAAAALWPDRIDGLVTYQGYDIQTIGNWEGFTAERQSAIWYQYMFQFDHGRAFLADNRREVCRLLWKQWSPTWDFSVDFFERTAVSFENPDFVDIVMHAYRYVFGTSKGDPELDDLAKRLLAQPTIAVPTITVTGRQDPLYPEGSATGDKMFVGRFEKRAFDVGHAFPSEAPQAFADAVVQVHQWAAK